MKTTEVVQGQGFLKQKRVKVSGQSLDHFHELLCEDWDLEGVLAAYDEYLVRKGWPLAYKAIGLAPEFPNGWEYTEGKSLEEVLEQGVVRVTNGRQYIQKHEAVELFSLDWACAELSFWLHHRLKDLANTSSLEIARTFFELGAKHTRYSENLQHGNAIKAHQNLKNSGGKKGADTDEIFEDMCRYIREGNLNYTEAARQVSMDLGLHETKTASIVKRFQREAARRGISAPVPQRD